MVTIASVIHNKTPGGSSTKTAVHQTAKLFILTQSNDRQPTTRPPTRYAGGKIPAGFLAECLRVTPDVTVVAANHHSTRSSDTDKPGQHRHRRIFFKLAVVEAGDHRFEIPMKAVAVRDPNLHKDTSTSTSTSTIPAAVMRNLRFGTTDAAGAAIRTSTRITIRTSTRTAIRTPTRTAVMMGNGRAAAAATTDPTAERRRRRRRRRERLPSLPTTHAEATSSSSTAGTTGNTSLTDTTATANTPTGPVVRTRAVMIGPRGRTAGEATTEAVIGTPRSGTVAAAVVG